jgi:site-specific DNA-methyltransferase (adenine-specific)
MSVRIFNEDCLYTLGRMPDNFIDLVVTSPPYDNLREYNGFSFDFESVAKGLYRVVKNGGVVVWIVGDATINGSETGTSFRQALYFKEIGFNLHDTMIWNKGTFTAVGALVSRYAPVFEYMFVFSKGSPKTFNPLRDRPNKGAGRKYHGTIRQRDGSTKPLSGIGKTISDFGQRHNIWRLFPEKRNSHRLHPAMFPEALAEDHLLSWSKEKDIVYDPFMGSGTTGVCAKRLGRKFIGSEISEEYFVVAKKRIEESK